MILTSYEVSNWGPHKNQKLEFPRGAKTIAICAENDQGKSWILRGIGFTLSIGRNEYGDQTSVHVGENESKHTLQFEQNGEIHTIEKIVRTKENEEEGTITFINGEKTDRAGFESFYNGLGLPHPSVWLPIVISMQNQTDYHLRSKKRDREEALRAACQLTRIDNWRDALSSKTNEEEKRLLSENASLNAKVETLSKTIAENEKTQNSIYNDIRSHSEFVLGTPNTTDPTDSDETAQKVIFIDELAPLLTLFREKESQSLREATALEGLKRGESLAELGVTRCKAELSNIPGSSAEQELAWEERRDTLQRETRSRRLSELIKKSTSVNKTLLAKETELLALGSKQNPEVLQSAKTQLRLCLHTAALLEGTNADVSALSTKLGCKTKEALSNLEETCKAHRTETQTIAAELRLSEKTIQTNALTLVSFLGTTPEALSIKPAHKTREAVESKILQLTAAQPTTTGPISEAEAERLMVRLLSHWESHPHESCPLCSQSLTGVGYLHDPTLRTKVLKTLSPLPMGDGLPHHEGGNKKESKAETEVPISVFEATAALENWETARKEAGINRRQAAALLKDRTLAEEPLDTILTKLAEEESRLTSTLSEIQRLNEKTVECEAHSRTLTLQRTSLENHNLHLAPGDAKPTTIPEWEALLESMASRNAKYDSLNTECNTLRREHAGYDEEIERIENEPAASPTSTLDPEEDKKIKDAPTHELQAEIKQLSEAILAARKNRQTRQVKEKELSGMEAKLESARATSKGASDSLEQIESELEQGCNIPLHPNLTATSLTSTSTSPSTPPSTGGVTHTPNRETLKELHSKSVSLWEHHLSEKRRLTAVLESLPEQIQSSKQELDGMRSLLETAEKETQRVAAARKLVNFLDYKNAPRKLLQNITERIFKTANEIAENLHVDIRLIVGKNLEFLTQQCRNGKWIEQKTERLGHGKGAMLGICFRLACQKLLLPETGFLILDEPTANVDIKRKSALKAFLQSLGEETESRARQIILIEHDVDVIELCQAKIHVGELANNTNPSANSDPNPNPNFNSNSNHPELP